MEDVLQRAEDLVGVYLDNNATTPPCERAVRRMVDVSRFNWGNASTPYSIGTRARDTLEDARARIAAVLDVSPRTITFTSSGTESNNIALRSVMRIAARAGRDVLMTSAVEHPSVDATAEHLPCKHVKIPVDAQGYIDQTAFRNLLRKHRSKLGMISIIMGQNEIGTIQPISTLVKIAREVAGSVPFHSDAVQVVGKYVVYPSSIGLDMLTCSAHKFHGLKGVGILYAREGLVSGANTPMTGGGQERGCRSGTENVAGIAAAADALQEMRRDDHVRVCRDSIMRTLATNIPGLRVHGDPATGLYNTLCVSLPQVNGLEFVKELDKRYGVCVGTSSACSKGSASKTLIAIYGPHDPAIRSTVRISLSRYQTMDECMRAASNIVDLWKKMLKH